MRHLVRHALGAALILGFAAEVHAIAPRGILLQRRGNVYRLPAKPAIIDSSPTIEVLNKALKALGSTDRDYGGHREKAVTHVGLAIRHLETASGRGKSNDAVDKAATGKPVTATRTATTSQAASDESLRKAKAILFSVHHQLTEKTATRGHLRADAEIRIALSEIAEALKPEKSTPPAKAAASTTTPTSASTTPTKPAK
jgi:hypothetical protein